MTIFQVTLSMKAQQNNRTIDFAKISESCALPNGRVKDRRRLPVILNAIEPAVGERYGRKDDAYDLIEAAV